MSSTAAGPTASMTCSTSSGLLSALASRCQSRSQRATTRSSTGGSSERRCPKHRCPRHTRSRSVRSSRASTLDVGWTNTSIEEPPSRDWPELADRAAQTGQPWTAELTSHVGTFLAIAHFVHTCEQPGPVVLTHKDIRPWNLLARDGRPVLLDWELSGMLDLASELGSTSLSLAKGPGLDTFEPAVFRAVLDGYVAAGGALPPPGPHWFVFMIGGWLGHTRWNILRCIAGTEASTGPDLALSQASARNGVRGLPDMFNRLPKLVALLDEGQ
jgi:Phosphotransferase enzyme family